MEGIQRGRSYHKLPKRFNTCCQHMLDDYVIYRRTMS